MSNFLNPFFTVRKHVKLRNSHTKFIEIDNLAFRLHYRMTSMILFVCSVLVTSRQYIGEHIKCIVGPGLNSRVVSSYCFFTSTFTVVKHIDSDLVDNGTLPHLGVGPYNIVDKEDEPIIQHAYYQWVPFLLFIQAVMFLLTHIVWKKWEGGRIRALLKGIEHAEFTFLEDEVKGGNGRIPSAEQKKAGISLIRDQFIRSNYITNFWPIGLILCEALNVIHVYWQMSITDKFLGGIFWSLGPQILNGSANGEDVLDTYFPKVTKCSFQKYGPTGTIQLHDVLCVMALNVINEKIYAFLWFWFVFVLGASIVNLAWRFFTIAMHSRSTRFNRYVLSTMTSGDVNTLAEYTLKDNLRYKDWIFLKYLSRNVEGLLFKEIVNELTEKIHRRNTNDEPDEFYKLST